MGRVLRGHFPKRVATADLLVGFACELEPEKEDYDRRQNGLDREARARRYSNLLHEMSAFAADHTMNLEIEAETSAPCGARSPERLKHSNSHRELGSDTRAGRIELAIAKLRKRNYFPSFLEPRRTAKKVIGMVIQQGPRPRRVDPPGRRLGQGYRRQRRVEEPD